MFPLRESKVILHLSVGLLCLLYFWGFAPDFLSAEQLSRLQQFLLGRGGVLQTGLGGLVFCLPVAYLTGLLVDGARTLLANQFECATAPFHQKQERTPASGERLACFALVLTFGIAWTAIQGSVFFWLALWAVLALWQPGDSRRTLVRDFAALDPNRPSPPVLQTALRVLFSGLLLQRTALRYALAKARFAADQDIAIEKADQVARSSFEQHEPVTHGLHKLREQKVELLGNFALVFAVLTWLGMQDWTGLHALATVLLMRSSLQGWLQLQTLRFEGLSGSAITDSASEKATEPTRHEEEDAAEEEREPAVELRPKPSAPRPELRPGKRVANTALRDSKPAGSDVSKPEPPIRREEERPEQPAPKRQQAKKAAKKRAKKTAKAKRKAAKKS